MELFKSTSCILQKHQTIFSLRLFMMSFVILIFFMSFLCWLLMKKKKLYKIQNFYMCMFGHINCGCHQKYKEKKCISDITNHLCMQHFAVYFFVWRHGINPSSSAKKKVNNIVRQSVFWTSLVIFKIKTPVKQKHFYYEIFVLTIPLLFFVGFIYFRFTFL